MSVVSCDTKHSYLQISVEQRQATWACCWTYCELISKSQKLSRVIKNTISLIESEKAVRKLGVL